MIVLDSSAIAAVILSEREASDFEKLLVVEPCIVGASTLVETWMVLEGRLVEGAGDLLNTLITERKIAIVPFDAAMYAAASRPSRAMAAGGIQRS